MTPPGTAAGRFLAAGLLGLVLGLVYGCLRPLRRRALADLLFLLAAGWAWLYLNFDICRGDIRPGITASLGVGALVWELTVGRLFRGAFLPLFLSLYRA